MRTRLTLAQAKASARLPNSVMSAQTKTPTIQAFTKQPNRKIATAPAPGWSTRKPKAQLPRAATRSEEHTSELQSQSNLVCRLLLEKKNYQQQRPHRPT